MAMMNEAPSSERVHIGFFGIRNAGKSSVVNKADLAEDELPAEEQGVPFTNYGITIAYMNGILQRSADAIGLEL